MLNLSLMQWVVIIITAPIWLPIGFLIAVFLVVGIPMLVQLIVISGGLGALWIFSNILKLFS